MPINVGDLQASLALDTRQFDKALTASERAANRAADNMARASRRQEQAAKAVAAAQEKVGRSMVAAGAAGAAALVGIGKAAIEAESSFADVRKTVNGTTAELDAIRSSLRDMSVNEIPTTANGLNEIAASAGQLGIKTENIVGFTRVIADLGETTNLAGSEGATQLARFANITQLAQDKFSNLGSALVALGNNFATTEAEISSMSLRIAAAGTQVGLSEADILGFSTALSSVGVEAEAGGTAISRVFVELQNATMSGGAALDEFARVAGTSATDFAAAFRDDAAGATLSFIAGLDGISKAGGNVFPVLDRLELGDIRVRDALLRAASAGTTFTDAIDLSSDAFRENTALSEEAAVRYETTAAKIAMAKNAVIDLAVELGDSLTPMIGAAAEGVAALGAWFADLSDPVQSVAAGMLAAATAIGLVGGGLLLLIPRIQATMQALTAMGVTADVVKGKLTAVNAVTFLGVGAAIANMAGLLAEARDEATGLADEIGRVAGGDAVAQINAYRDALVDANDARGGVGDRLTLAFTDPAETLRQVAAVEELEGRVEGLARSLEAAADTGRSFTDQQEALNYYLDQGYGYSEAFAAASMALANATEAASTATDGWANRINDAGTAIDGATTGISAMGEATTTAGDVIGDYRDAIAGAGIDTDAFNDIIDRSQPNLEGLASTMEGLVNPISAYQEAVEDAADGTEASFADMLDNLRQQVQAQADVGRNFAAVAARVPAEFLPHLQEIADETPDLLATMVEASQDELDELVRLSGITGADTVDAISTGMQLLPDILATYGQEGVDGFIDALSSGTGRAAQVVADYRVALANGLNPLLIAVGRQALSTNGSVDNVVRRQNASAQADGSVRTYANGGVEDHVAQIARPGEWRVWAEDETGGEAYIPLAPSKRTRSLAIWRETGRRLGVFNSGADVPDVAGDTHDGGPRFFAAGGFTDTASVPTPRVAPPGVGPISDAAGGVMDAMYRAVMDTLPSLLVPQIGAGVDRMMGWLRQTFPALPLYSGARPGAITATGNGSYHGKVANDGSIGRAVDIPPRLDVNRHIADNVPHSRELILSLPGSVNISNGQRRGFFGEPTFSDHLDHNHWALADGGLLSNVLGVPRRQRYDVGGLLPTGTTIAQNDSGAPEIIVPSQNVDDLLAAVTEMVGGLADLNRQIDRVAGDRADAQAIVDDPAASAEDREDAAEDVAELTAELDRLAAQAVVAAGAVDAANVAAGEALAPVGDLLGLTRQAGESWEDFAVRVANATDDVFANLSPEDQLAVLRDMMADLAPFSAAWIEVRDAVVATETAILDTETAIREAAANIAAAALDIIVGGVEGAFADLSRMLAAEEAVRDRMVSVRQRAAEQTVAAAESHEDQVAAIREAGADRRLALEQAYSDRVAAAVQSRIDALAASFDVATGGGRGGFDLAALAQAVTDGLTIGLQQGSITFDAGPVDVAGRIGQGTDRLAGQFAGLDDLRALGLTEEAIGFLGLAIGGPDAADTITDLLSGPAADVVAISAEVSRRLAVAADIAASESDRLVGVLGGQLGDLGREQASALDDLNVQLARQLGDAYDQHREALDRIARDLDTALADLNGELAAIGVDTSLTITEAIAAGLDSDNPAIREAAAGLATMLGDALREAGAAAAAAIAEALGSTVADVIGGADTGGRTVDSNGNVAPTPALRPPAPPAAPVVPFQRPSDSPSGPVAPFQRPPAPVTPFQRPPVGQTFGGGGGLVPFRRATFDVGGWLEPGYTLAFNGTGQRERVVPPSGSMGGVQVNVNVDARGAQEGAADQIRRELDQWSRGMADQLTQTLGG